MLGKTRRGVLDGEQTGLYLTSGLKHSFRKGRRQAGGKKLFSTFIMRSKPPFSFRAQFRGGLKFSEFLLAKQYLDA